MLTDSLRRSAGRVHIPLPRHDDRDMARGIIAAFLIWAGLLPISALRCFAVTGSSHE